MGGSAFTTRRRWRRSIRSRSRTCGARSTRRSWRRSTMRGRRWRPRRRPCARRCGTRRRGRSACCWSICRRAAQGEVKRANVPLGWAAPAFDVLQLEDYDWVTGGRERRRRGRGDGGPARLSGERSSIISRGSCLRREDVGALGADRGGGRGGAGARDGGGVRLGAAAGASRRVHLFRQERGRGGFRGRALSDRAWAGGERRARFLDRDRDHGERRRAAQRRLGGRAAAASTPGRGCGARRICTSFSPSSARGGGRRWRSGSGTRSITARTG